jgi:23S rRNA (guanosine2251-2'-O)-methyltransferase
MRRGPPRPFERRPPRPPSNLELPEGRLVLGLQPVREAIRVHGKALTGLALDARDSPRLEALERFARDHDIERVERLPQSELDRLSGGVSHQGAAAWAPPLRFTELDELLGDPELVALCLDKIQDPQNFGAVVRSAVGVAEAAVIWGEHSAAPLSTAMGRASAGAVEHARLCRVPSLVTALGQAMTAGVQVLGLDARAPRALRDVDLRAPTVLVVGAEHTGLGGAVRRSCGELVRLVPTRKIDSLNASVAAAIALYEVAIQRTNPNT